MRFNLKKYFFMEVAFNNVSYCLNAKYLQQTLGETVCIFLILLIAAVQRSIECETQEGYVGYINGFILA